MSASATHLARMARTTKKLEKPRPLKSMNQNRHSTIETRQGTVEEIMNLADSVASHIANRNFDRTLQSNIKSLHDVLKVYGSKLETIYKDQLDRAFVTFRNGCRDELLDYFSRLYLLELIELRAMQWNNQDLTSYYKHKLTSIDVDAIPTPTIEQNFSPVFPMVAPIVMAPIQQPQPLLLGPGELVKSSGKYPAPTKVIGKNYCKDEVVIRNSDSGKVNPGAKERLVQITGPAEDKINYARQLMEETIRRNASPVRADGELDRLGSNSSLNSSASDEMWPYNQGGNRQLLHSFSTNDATLGEYKYTVTVGEENLKITGTNLDLVRIAKLVLDEYFSPSANEAYTEYEEGQDVFEHIEPQPIYKTQDSIESQDTYRVHPETDDVKKNSSFSPFSTQNSIITEISPVKRYSIEELIKYVDSPLSRQTPVNWAKVIRDCPSILKKSPIEWLDSTACMQLLTKNIEFQNTSPSPTEE